MTCCLHLAGVRWYDQIQLGEDNAPAFDHHLRLGNNHAQYHVCSDQSHHAMYGHIDPSDLGDVQWLNMN